MLEKQRKKNRKLKSEMEKLKKKTFLNKTVEKK